MGFPNDDEARLENKFIKWVKLIIIVVLFFLAFGIGLVVGAFLRAPACSPTPVNTREANMRAAQQQFQKDINATEIGYNLK